jgi:glyoxylase-like metal-dependent hydrolase (beta-lactamase superfamily II)
MEVLRFKENRVPAYQIEPLDLRFHGAPEVIASFLVTGPGGPVLVESGPGSTLPALLAALDARGLKPADVRDVLVTHIHLDHAGAAGWWARQGARITVHPVGAPHLIDPSRLLASAERIYGPMLGPLWGEILPAPAERVNAVGDGAVVVAGGLEFTALDTPGHARHHHVWALDGTAFTGDLAGVRLPKQTHTRLPTPPPEFELEAWQASVAAMRERRFERLYLTHFGLVEGEATVDAHWATVARLLDEDSGLVQRELAAGASRDEVIRELEALQAERQRAAGLDESARTRYSSVGPTGMSAAGLIRYWRKQGLGVAAREPRAGAPAAGEISAGEVAAGEVPAGEASAGEGPPERTR